MAGLLSLRYGGGHDCRAAAIFRRARLRKAPESCERESVVRPDRVEIYAIGCDVGCVEKDGKEGEKEGGDRSIV